MAVGSELHQVTGFWTEEVAKECSEASSFGQAPVNVNIVRVW